MFLIIKMEKLQLIRHKELMKLISFITKKEHEYFFNYNISRQKTTELKKVLHLEPFDKNQNNIKEVVISGSGNVAIYASEKVIQLGGKVIALSDSNGTLINQEGLDIEIIKQIKEVDKKRLSEYNNTIKQLNNNTLGGFTESEFIPKEEYVSGQHKIWNIPNTDIALPCATQNELNLNDVRNLYKNNEDILILECANMPTTSSALEFILENNILFAPGKAANAGGVATSFLEMSQNASLEKWHFSKVEQKIEDIMYGIFINSYNTAKKQGNDRNLVMGANIYSFNRLVEGMNNQGIIS